jgi:hypothetical protein
LLAVLPLRLLAEEPVKNAGTPDAPQGLSLVLLDDQKVSGRYVGFRDGKLGIAADAEQWIALDEIQSLKYSDGKSAAVTEKNGLVWIGQDNQDRVQVGSAAGANGIQDMHLQLRGLPVAQAIKQIILQCRYATPAADGRPAKAQLRVWRLDPTGSPHWRLAMDRGESGHAAVADLFVEPSDMDAMDQEFLATVTYENGSTGKLTCKAMTHTSDKAKSSGAGNTPAATATSADIPPEMKGSLTWCRITLRGQAQLLAELISIDEETLVAKPLGQESLSIPMKEIAALQIMALASQQEFAQQFAKLSATPGSEDTILIRGNDQGRPATISGIVKGFANNELKVFFDEQDRALPLAKLTGIVFAVQPKGSKSTEATHVVSTIRHEKFLGNLVDVGASDITLELPWHAKLKFKAADVVEVQLIGGRMAYLSDMEPQSVEQTPFFGRTLPYQRDRSLTGGTLKMKAKEYTKGLAVHSRCVLTYPLDGQYERFVTLAGFDDATGGKGSVVCRVLADGKELFKNEHLAASGDPTTISVSVAGARLLTVEVDFGDQEDTGDRVIFADARLLRVPNKKAS